MKKYYVYAYCDPLFNHQPFYVGKGTGNRKNKHLYETIDTAENIRKFERIKLIRSAEVEPLIQVIKDGLDEEQSYKLEKDLIQLWGRQDYDAGGILCNICIDSRPPGMRDKTHTEETKEVQRQQRLKWLQNNTHPKLGVKLTDVARLTISSRRKIEGSTITEEGRSKIAKSSSLRNSGAGNPNHGRKRKAMYNPTTLQCRYVDISLGLTEVENLQLAGWQFGPLRKIKVS